MKSPFQLFLFILSTVIGFSSNAQLSVYPNYLREEGDTIFAEFRMIYITGADPETKIIEFEEVGVEKASFYRSIAGIQLDTNWYNYTYDIDISKFEDAKELPVITLFHKNFTHEEVHDDILITQVVIHTNSKYIMIQKENYKIKAIEIKDLD